MKASTLDQQLSQAISAVPKEKMKFLIEFARFLCTQSSSFEDKSETISTQRKSIIGRARGEVRMADDFNDTPDCFKEYL